MIVSFVRHASTRWNELGRMQGHRDVPLSRQGRAQVAAWRLPAIDDAPLCWLSSPLARAVETAELAGATEPERVPALIEMDWGDWEGETLPDLRSRYGAAFERNEAAGLDFRPPRGESPREVRERVQRWLIQLAPRAEALVCVTHNGVLRALLSAAIGWDMTTKPPVRLQRDTLHRFAAKPDGRITMVDYNVPLVLPPAPTR
jgi:probable phosphoglycerate mutase